MADSSTSISGSWFGNYYYASGSTPSGFEAVFVQSGSAISGNILDLARLGEATVTGTFLSQKLDFTKVYYKGGHSPVVYRGSMSSDGKTISGTWEIAPISRGSWIAWRVEEKEDLSELTTDGDVEAEKELAPLVEAAPGRR